MFSSRRLIGVVAVAVGLLLPATASADGSHFIAELNNGLAFPLGYEEGYDPGYALGLTAGFGGKFKGNPVRFYLIGQFNSASFSADRLYNGKRRLIDRTVTDFNGGLRMLVPVQRHLRVYGDLALGVAQTDSQAASPDLPANIVIRDTESNVALFTGIGVQYRLFYHLSLGGKLDFAFMFHDGDVDAVTAATSAESGEGRLGRMNTYLTATFHF